MDMTFPKTIKSIKMLIGAEIIALISDILTIALISIVLQAFSDGIDFEHSSPELLIPSIVLMILLLTAGICTSILYLVSFRKASAEDQNFRISFYSSVITLFLSVISVFSYSSKEVSNITDLLTTLTTLLSQVYVLEGIRSISRQLKVPKMDRQGAVIYAIITTIFVFQTLLSVFILVLGGSMATAGASWLGIAASVLSIFECLIFLNYYIKALRMLTTSP